MVIAEIQQRSDATFRLFDYGRQRELHEDSAVPVPIPGPPQLRPPQSSRRPRTILIASPHFALERMSLPANSIWGINAGRKPGCSYRRQPADRPDKRVGRRCCLSEADHAGIEAGPDGMSGLMAYPRTGPHRRPLQEAGKQLTKSAGHPSAVRSPKSPEG